MQEYIKIHKDDNVAVALAPLEKGKKIQLDSLEMTLVEDIPQGHKFLLRDMDKNQAVIKYGYSIGIAKNDIVAGSWVHTHNVHTSLGDVLNYGEPVAIRGLNLLSAPGNDLVASTALAASGAHIVLFTTGRGTPFACPVPTVKISTNSTLNNKKNNWIDFNCGTLVENETLENLAERMFQYVIDVASGKKVKAEEQGFHDMAIFKQGVTL
ncbi:MAG: UxaA family hydrolase [Eubacteriales bacterium]